MVAAAARLRRADSRTGDRRLCGSGERIEWSEWVAAPTSDVRNLRCSPLRGAAERWTTARAHPSATLTDVLNLFVAASHQRRSL